MLPSSSSESLTGALRSAVLVVLNVVISGVDLVDVITFESEFTIIQSSNVSGG